MIDTQITECPFVVGAKVAFTRVIGGSKLAIFNTTLHFVNYDEIEIFREGIIDRVLDDGDFFLVGDKTRYWPEFNRFDDNMWTAINSPYHPDQEELEKNMSDEECEELFQDEVSYDFKCGECIQIYDDRLTKTIASHKKNKEFKKIVENLKDSMEAFPKLDESTGETNVTDEILESIKKLQSLIS